LFAACTIWNLLGFAGANFVEEILILGPKSILIFSKNQVNKISHQDDEAQMVLF
jgi:hypothetical protein